MTAQLAALLRRMIRDTDALMAQYAGGELDAAAWERAVRRVLARMHTAALLAGTGETTLTSEQRAMLQELIADQRQYLAGFRQDLATLSPAAARARAVLYSGALKETYWHGKTWGWPLPAMPAQGTQCRTNCGCSWEIVELDGDGNADAYWRRGTGDSCQTCEVREQQWSPVRIRNGELQL